MTFLHFLPVELSLFWYFFGADFIATTIMHLDMSAYALRVLAPCVS